MNKNKLKWIVLGLACILAVLVLILGRKGRGHEEDNQEKAGYESVYVSCKDMPSLQIRPCRAENTEDDTLFLFLPFAEQRYVWNVPDGMHLYVNTKPCETGDEMEELVPGERYLFAIEEGGEFTDAHYLMCMKGDRIPAISLTIGEEKLNGIVTEDYPLHMEQAGFRIYDVDENGGLREDCHTTCTTGGHGNSTWLNDKKSFEFDTGIPISPLGMADSVKWNLIANGMDRSLVKNRIVYEAACSTNMEYSIDCRYVNCYINGIYQGLYLLTEKPETAYGSYMMEFKQYDPNIVANMTDPWFYTSMTSDSEGNNYMVRIKYPPNVNARETAYLKEYVNETERALYSEGGVDQDTGLDFHERMDMYSWAMSYLFLDFFAYQDSSAGSLFFYKKRNDKLLYSGPVWDYDKSMTDDFVAVDDFPWYGRGAIYLWYERLDGFEDFHDQVVGNYKDELSPAVDEIIETKLPAWMKEIESSEAMDDIRWNRGIGYGEMHTKDVQEWLTKRKELFDAVWIRGEESPYAENIY